MHPTIVFVDRDEKFVSEVCRLLGDSFAGYYIEYVTENVMRMPRRDCLFVSPANSLGFMDGGIDAAYMEMFEGIEPRVKSAIAELGFVSALDRPYMSVGSAVVVPAQPSTNTWLASCPTMFLPGNVYGTNNAYYAFGAALGAFEKARAAHGVTTMVCPGLATGVGKMPVDESAAQIRDALEDKARGAARPEVVDAGADAFITASTDALQPTNYMHREIQGEVGGRRHPEK
nr:Macro domain containing protein [Oceanusvirus sp.]